MTQGRIASPAPQSSPAVTTPDASADSPVQAQAASPRTRKAASTAESVHGAARATHQRDQKSTLDHLLLELESRARAARNVPELAFSIANETYGLLNFRQALVIQNDPKKLQLKAVSGLAKPAEDSPYLVWLRRVWRWLHPEISAQPGWFMPDKSRLPEEFATGWSEWWTTGIWAVPLKSRDGRVLAWAVFLMETSPATWQFDAVARLSATWGYAWEMLAGATSRRRISARWSWSNPWVRWLLLLLIVLVALIPVPQTVLAPAELVSLQSQVVASPLEGVIKTVHVRPNQTVKEGDPLFSLDDTTLRSRYEVAREAVAVADAELVAASQRVFQDASTQSEIAVLTGRAHERRAELEAVRAQLNRIDVFAAKDGVVVFGDVDDWLGRPVAIGERVMTLADPAYPGMLIHLPVADALALEPGALVKLFLTVQPLKPLEGAILETSYQATQSPEGIVSYRLRAAFDQDQDTQGVRIGLRGTAKLYGDSVMLGYYILRRPIAAVREWTGW